MIKKFILVLILSFVYSLPAVAEYENYDAISPDSLPSLDTSSHDSLTTRLQKYIELGEKLATSFESVLSGYEDTLNSFMSYKNSCLEATLPSGVEGGSLWYEIEAVCSLQSLDSVKGELRGLSGRLDVLEEKLDSVKIKIEVAQKQIEALSRSSDFYEKMDRATKGLSKSKEYRDALEKLEGLRSNQ